MVWTREQQKSFKKAHMKRGLFQGLQKYFACIVIARKLWDALLSLSPSISCPSSLPQTILPQPCQNETSTLVCLHDLLSPALVVKQLECWLVSEFNLQ